MELTQSAISGIPFPEILKTGILKWHSAISQEANPECPVFAATGGRSTGIRATPQGCIPEMQRTQKDGFPYACIGMHAVGTPQNRDGNTTQNAFRKCRECKQADSGITFPEMYA